MTRPKVDGLYAITPDIADTASLVSMTRQVLAGGARLIQYRNKTANAVLRLEQARLLASLCREFYVPLIVNDHLDLAVEVNADGVHVGQGDASIAEARRKLGDGKIVGASCYNRLEHAFEAERQGADYVAFGAFYVSSTKPGAVRASMDLLRRAKATLCVPVVAIGGITARAAGELIQEGAVAVAVSSALFEVQNIQSAAESFAGLFNRNCNSITH
ncbi:thiamine phosphate synthase [Nitrosovibrio tenuis]|uniref:Thiamine-phosphate synthase n=1 Tax=Nitrosovibrio tenuis TaxID=1233 RepID=A0A1H7R594_9PROT|nr:thiamine phosphate synthase [Nitrosovibrio tenuis]SEL55411.1 thiamine-phosphate diphosphorylase [Nitrosovibrio tenuis]